MNRVETVTVIAVENGWTVTTHYQLGYGLEVPIHDEYDNITAIDRKQTTTYICKSISEVLENVAQVINQEK